MWATRVFSLFTLRNNFSSMYGKIFWGVRSALFRLLQKIIQSSAIPYKPVSSAFQLLVQLIQHYVIHLFERKPKLLSENCSSKIGDSLFRRYYLQMTLCIRLSILKFALGHIHLPRTSGFFHLLKFSPFRDSCNHHGTMASADFSPFVVTTASYSVSTTGETSLSTTRFFPSIYLPHLLCTVPYSYWTLVCIATLSPYIACMWFLFVRPEVWPSLPSDSTSRWTPLLFGHILPTVGRIRDFHPLETCAVRHTTKGISLEFNNNFYRETPFLDLLHINIIYNYRLFRLISRSESV